MPALFTSTSSRCQRATTAPTARSTSADRVTSATSGKRLRPQRLGGGLRAGTVEVEHRHAGAVGGEALRDGQPDAAGGAGDERGPSFE